MSYFDVRTDRVAAETFVARLTELETAMEKQKNAIKFFTPSAPIIGLNAATGAPYTSYSNTNASHGGMFSQQQYDRSVMDSPEEEVIDEYQDMRSDGSDLIDPMQELEDSTGSPN